MPVKKWCCVVVPIAAVGVLASWCMVFMDASSQWYVSLAKPGIYPPEGAFPIAWAVIYALMALSMTLLCMRGKTKDFYLPYAINAALQVLWTYLFGERHLLASAMWCLLLLTAQTYILYRMAHKVDKNIAWLHIPYFLWLIYACALNYALVMMN